MLFLYNISNTRAEEYIQLNGINIKQQYEIVYSWKAFCSSTWCIRPTDLITGDEGNSLLQVEHNLFGISLTFSYSQ